MMAVNKSEQKQGLRFNHLSRDLELELDTKNIKKLYRFFGPEIMLAKISKSVK